MALSVARPGQRGSGLAGQLVDRQRLDRLSVHETDQRGSGTTADADRYVERLSGGQGVVIAERTRTARAPRDQIEAATGLSGQVDPDMPRLDPVQDRTFG